eukprot:CAMPEP_0116929836 /NCGR_PEP_ID=MMETSP0467-20121206/26822_1 /TAXON_ID=283647 /ORGANISM="Mesodinium pulex, Strain SPMC105" /LENGTH=172 /DNA_ID=CAMNT_0004609889 /DNA_START=212 /DNA_END=730 /DNA_ORIENTATION=-
MVETLKNSLNRHLAELDMSDVDAKIGTVLNSLALNVNNGRTSDSALDAEIDLPPGINYDKELLKRKRERSGNNSNSGVQPNTITMNSWTNICIQRIRVSNLSPKLNKPTNTTAIEVSQITEITLDKQTVHMSHTNTNTNTSERKSKKTECSFKVRVMPQRMCLKDVNSMQTG